MTHPLCVRLLRNRAEFYRELLERIPWDDLRTEFEHAAAGLPELESIDATAPVPAASSALLRGLLLDEWLKKDGVGVPRARRVISVENALSEAMQLEELGILLCDALAEESPGSAENLQTVRAGHVRAFLALSELRDRLDYHRLTLVGGCIYPESNDLE